MRLNNAGSTIEWRLPRTFSGPLDPLATSLFTARMVGLALAPALIVTPAGVGSAVASIPEWRGKRSRGSPMDGS